MMDRSDFEKLVEEALLNIPTDFARKMENVEIVIENEPSAREKAELNLSPYTTLFGLYTGIPKIKRGTGYTFVLPDKITIFQKPIEQYCRTPQEIRNQIRKTVLHEIGHHFGLSEDSLSHTKVG